MALEITPGPFDASDGDRIKPEEVITPFVSGTEITSFGLPELKELRNLPVSSTNPPDLADRTRGTLWFRRGEGRLYKWDIIPSGATDGRWVCMSDRKDVLVRYSGSVTAGEILWRDTSVSLPAFQYGRFARQVLNVAGGATGNEFDTTPRESFIPPHFVCQTEGVAGQYQVVVDRGYHAVSAVGSTGPSHGTLEKGVLPTKLVAKADPLPTGDGTITFMAYITESQPAAATGCLMAFFTGLGSNLTS